MSYAIRNDGAGWRAAGGPDDCGPDETWQADQPPMVSFEPGPIDQIAALETASMLPRVAREFMLAGLELEGARHVPPITPEQLYAANIGYKKLRDLDDQIAALRAAL